MTIKSKIQSLITAANTKTGESDTTLTDAVQTLIDGYGQGGEEITLPAEYQRVEFISKVNSSGAYINTGYVPEMNTDIFVRASIDGKRDQKFFGGFGTGSGSGAGFALAQVGDTWRATIGVGWNAIGTAVVDTPTDFLVELRETRYTIWIDNQALLNTTNKELVYPLYILATNYNNSVSSGFGGNIYGVTVRRGNTILRDYIPCYRKADGVIGMYEIVTETFLTNAGGGSFGKGADVDDAIPSGGGITPTGTKQISITQNGTTTEDVTQYANAEITVNVPSGASLPSVISKIDGGSFTLASDTAGNNHWISHNLGVLPKCIIIWTDDSDLRTSTSAVARRYLLCSQLSLIDWVTGTASNALIPNHLFRNTNGATSNTGSPITQSAVGNYIQTTRFNNALGAAYYKAGVEYKWVAYA